MEILTLLHSFVPLSPTDMGHARSLLHKSVNRTMRNGDTCRQEPGCGEHIEHEETRRVSSLLKRQGETSIKP